LDRLVRIQLRNEDGGGRTTGAALGSKEFDDDGNLCGVLIIGGARMERGKIAANKSAGKEDRAALPENMAESLAQDTPSESRAAVQGGSGWVVSQSCVAREQDGLGYGRF